MRAVIAIPAYNCAPQIGRVLDEIDDATAARVEAIWVIDNGSTDDTVARALDHQEGGRLPGLRVLRNRANVNLGGTHKAAFEHARSAGYTHVVILHGDNQADSREVARLLDVSERSGRTALGSRFNRRSRLHGYDTRRILGNKVLNVLYSVAAWHRLEDLGSGLNVFRIADLDRRTYLGFANSLTFNFELILDLVRRRVRFVYVPITWREEDQVTNARNWKVFRTALVNLARWRLGLSRPSAPEGQAYEWDEVTR